MAPRAQTPSKNLPTKNEPPRGAALAKNPSAKGVKKKEKKEKKKKKLKLKGWLETPADWARFNTWAKINAQPRVIPEPEPIVRASKPLAQMKKRIEVLSKPQKKPRPSCRRDLGVSKKALKAKPSKRIKILAKFVEKKIDCGREFPIKISRAALHYRASKRIIEISKPHEMVLSEQCKSLMDMTKDVTTEKTISRKTRLALLEKAIHCPDLVTDEEMDILMTPTGIYRSALSYKFTPWMKYLSLPSYRFLRYQDGETPTEWKKYILEENESRGKRALEEKRKKEAAKKKKDQEETSKLDEKPAIEEKESEDTDEANQETPVIEKEAEETATIEPEAEETPTIEPETEEAPTIEPESEENKDNEEVVEPQEEKTMNEETAKANEAEEAEKNKEDSEKKKEDFEKKKEESSRIAKKGNADDAKKNKEDNEEAAKRKAERNAWRFVPPPCKDDPFAIKRSALKGKVSPRMAELALPSIHEDRSCRKDPFSVRKSALTGPIPEGVSRLAIPNHPRDPIEKPPPREKDSFGRPIYPMPPYGKKMPRVKPFEPAECPDKDKKEDEDETRKKEKKKRRVIDPIVYEPTIDPCIDPEGSTRQIKARKAAKEILNKRKEVKGKSDKEGGEKGSEQKVEQPIEQAVDQTEDKDDDNVNESPETQNADNE